MRWFRFVRWIFILYVYTKLCYYTYICKKIVQSDFFFTLSSVFFFFSSYWRAQILLTKKYENPYYPYFFSKSPIKNNGSKNLQNPLAGKLLVSIVYNKLTTTCLHYSNLKEQRIHTTGGFFMHVWNYKRSYPCRLNMYEGIRQKFVRETELKLYSITQNFAVKCSVWVLRVLLRYMQVAFKM